MIGHWMVAQIQFFPMPCRRMGTVHRYCNYLAWGETTPFVSVEFCDESPDRPPYGVPSTLLVTYSQSLGYSGPFCSRVSFELLMKHAFMPTPVLAFHMV